MEFLPTLWFVLIMVLWIGYLFLDGFDLGVGMNMSFAARTNKERRVLLNTIGPVWDGNEVWLITAIGAMFAAMPNWYAAALSAMYLPFLFILVGLIFRATGIEYRGKVDSERWRTVWTWAISLGSLCAAFWIGVVLATMSWGLPLNENHDRVGGALAWVSWPGLLGGIAVVLFCLSQANAFLTLKTSGEVRAKYAGLFKKTALLFGIPMIGWLIVVNAQPSHVLAWVMVVVGVLALAGAWIAARAGRDGWQFAAHGVFLVAIMVGVGLAMFPMALPSTLDPAFGLTVNDAAAATYTLTFVTVAAAIGVPIVLAYQIWTYWVFRRRISTKSIPKAHPIVAAIKSKILVDPDAPRSNAS